MTVQERGLKQNTVRLLYIIAGTLSLIIGIVGIVLPVLPTTPFLLLSAACYYRGSEKLHSWLIQSKLFGPTIRDFEEKGGMKQSTKIKALVMLWVTVLVSAFLVLDSFIHRLGVIVLASIGTFFILRIKTIS